MKSVQKITLSALFLALGLILPFLTGQIQHFGQMLLPMHYPIFLCGLICGWQYGLLVGFILPLLRSTIFGMPMMFPMAVAMAFELAGYGAMSGWMFSRAKKKNTVSVYTSLIAAMICGRVIYGLVMTLITSMLGQPYSFQIFITAAITSGIPGIIAQLILIPAIMILLDKTGILHFEQK